MKYPQFRKFFASKPRNGISPRQWYMVISEDSALNLREDQVIGFGISENMPPETVAAILENYNEATPAEFIAALRRIKEKFEEVLIDQKIF